MYKSVDNSTYSILLQVTAQVKVALRVMSLALCAPPDADAELDKDIIINPHLPIEFEENHIAGYDCSYIR